MAAFVGAKRLHSRVEIAVDALSRPGPGVWSTCTGVTSTEPGTSTAGGPREWRRTLRRTDRELARLARTLPPGTLLLITADHGMIDVPHTERMDLADAPWLCQDVTVLGGEGRFAQLYCRPDATEQDVGAVADRLADAVGDRAWVRTRDVRRSIRAGSVPSGRPSDPGSAT